MTRVILDTNYIIGLIDERDIHHGRARRIEERLIKEDAQFVYLDCVINEVVSVGVRRLIERKRSHEVGGFLETVQKRCPKERITWMYPEMERFFVPVLRLVRNSNGALNFHDALIVQIATELDIPHIVSFDEDFDKVGLKRIKEIRDL